MVLDVNVIDPVELLKMPLATAPPAIVFDDPVIVPVELFITAEKVDPPVTVQDVKVIVPVDVFIVQFAALPLVIELDVIVIVPVELLLMAKAFAPLPPVKALAFVNAIVPAIDVDSMACAPSAVVVPTTLPPVVTIPLSVNVPLDENAIARVDRVNADPVARHPASVELAAAETVKQFADPAWMYAPVIFQFAARVKLPPVAIVSGALT
jgi:hypothetical protein